MSEQEKDGSMPEVRPGQTWRWRDFSPVVTVEELDADEGFWLVRHPDLDESGWMYLAESTREHWTLVKDVEEAA